MDAIRSRAKTEGMRDITLMKNNWKRGLANDGMAEFRGRGEGWPQRRQEGVQEIVMELH